jgi:hypothetical protein
VDSFSLEIEHTKREKSGPELKSYGESGILGHYIKNWTASLSDGGVLTPSLD